MDKPEADAHDPQDYVGVASIFPPQQARPQMLGVVQAIEVGEFNGSREYLAKRYHSSGKYEMNPILLQLWPLWSWPIKS